MPEYPTVFVNDGAGGQIPFPPFIPQEVMNTLAGEFVTFDDDLFVVTYPKAGTTWTEQIVHLMLNNGEQGEQVLTDTAPWIETLPMRSPGMEEFLATLKGRRLFTSHLPLALMPDFSGSKGKYIYVARNPKDVAVSFYHHDRSKMGYEGSWDEFFTLYIAGKVTYGSFFDHVLPWWQTSHTADNILFLLYEDMKRDLPAVVEQIAGFIDIPLNQSLLESVVGGSDFQAMVKNDKTNFNWMPQRADLPGHFRKGIVGDWRSQFSPEQSELLDEVTIKKLSGTNLRFDFGEGLILP